MNDHANEHAWLHEQLATAAIGGLDAQDLARFQNHAAQCPPCADELRALTDEDQRLADLFASARPAPGFEDRLIQGLRSSSRPRMRIPPAVRIAVSGVAAAIVLGAFGF